MIIIKYLDENKELQEIKATGLGDLGWQLDCMGCDTSSEDDRFSVVSMEIVERGDE